MMGGNDEEDPVSLGDPSLKEQDKGIIEAFARENHQVLTTTEISKYVSLSNRQVRRRLNELSDRGMIGQRVVSGVKLAWLEEDVKEPITVRYPLLTYVRDRVSVQLFLMGVASGIVAVLVLLAAAISIGYNVPIGFISREQFLVYGVLAAIISAMFIIIAALVAVIGQIMRYFGFNLEAQIENLRD